jgi:hypothetical protein
MKIIIDNKTILQVEDKIDIDNVDLKGINEKTIYEC